MKWLLRSALLWLAAASGACGRDAGEATRPSDAAPADAAAPDDACEIALADAREISLDGL